MNEKYFLRMAFKTGPPVSKPQFNKRKQQRQFKAKSTFFLLPEVQRAIKKGNRRTRTAKVAASFDVSAADSLAALQRLAASARSDAAYDSRDISASTASAGDSSRTCTFLALATLQLISQLHLSSKSFSLFEPFSFIHQPNTTI